MCKLTSLCKQNLLGKLEEKENELNSEKKNALKRDKAIQGLTQVLKEKEKEVRVMMLLTNKNCCCVMKSLTPTCLTQIAELCHEIEDRDDALAKAREAAHKAQLQKYQASPAPFYREPNIFISILLTNTHCRLCEDKHFLRISLRE